MKKFINFAFMIILMFAFLIFPTGCAKKKDVLGNYKEWETKNIAVKDDVLSSTDKNSFIFNGNIDNKNNIFEFNFKCSKAKFSVIFGAENIEKGYSIEYLSDKELLIVYHLTNGSKKELYKKSCLLNDEKWYTFRLETFDDEVKIFINDESNDDDTLPKLNFSIGYYNYGLGINMKNCQVKDIYRHENKTPTERDESTFVNPVDFAVSPNVIYSKGIYYMYANSEIGNGIDLYCSYDLIGWNNFGAVLDTTLSIGNQISAPSVVSYKNEFYMCYTSDGRLAIASSSLPNNKFSQKNKEFLSDNKETDGSLFIDSKPYIFFTREENGQKNIYVAEMENDLSTYIQNSVKKIVENASSPKIIKDNNKYFLMYSVVSENVIEIYYSQAETILGEYSEKKLLLGSSNQSKGYSSPSIVSSPDGSEKLIVYQALDSKAVHVDRAYISNNLSVDAPSNLKQNVPNGVKRIMHVGNMDIDENTRKNDLLFAINLAAENVSGSLDYDNHYFPVWNANITSNGNAIFSNGWHGHNIGRWMDAMYRWQDTTKQTIDPFLKNVMLNNTKWFFNNSDGICLQPIAERNSTFFDLHSLREGMAALNAIIEHETGEWYDWAIMAADKMITTVNTNLSDNMVWNLNNFEYRKTAQADLNNYYDSCGSSGRFCEMLMQNYDLTKSAKGLALAKRIVEYNYNFSTTSTGDINYASKPNHTHSYQNTLQAMLRYGIATGEQKYIDRVKITFDKTILRLVTESGVVTHDLESGAQGWETSSTSDALQLAMWLYDIGYTQYGDFAEKLLRARLLPAQFVEGDKLIYSSTGSGLSWQMKNRVNGGYSMLFDSPYSGKFTTTDVTCHVLQALIDAYNHIEKIENERIYLMFHFDYESENISAKAMRDERAEFKVIAKTKKPISIRLPNFTDDIIVKLNGKVVEPIIDDVYAVFNELDENDEIVISYELPTKTTTETHTNGVTYTISWIGNEIEEILPKSNFFPMFK